MINNLYKKYQKEVAPRLRKELGLKTIMQAPRVSKIVLNVGVGKFVKESGYIDNVVNTLTKITGQKPVRTRAKQAISNFKIRAGMEIGVKVTLRGRRLYDFLEKLLAVTLPRVKDFRGISPDSFDAVGNYHLGLKEHLAFPEIKADEIDKIHGLEITVVITAGDREAAHKLLSYLGFPFKKK